MQYTSRLYRPMGACFVPLALDLQAQVSQARPSPFECDKCTLHCDAGSCSIIIEVSLHKSASA